MKQKKKLGRKLLSFLLTLAMVFSTMTGIVPGMSLTAQATSYEDKTWSENQIITENAEIGKLIVTEDITVTIAEDVTVTVYYGIDATGHTLTVTGEGTLTVTGKAGDSSVDATDSTGGDGIIGNIVVNGANVIVSGGDSGWRVDGCPGGNGVTGNVTVKSGSFNGTGGNGASSNTHNGGIGVYGNVIVEGGNAIMTGGTGGYGSTIDGSGGDGVDGNVTVIGGAASAIGGGKPNYRGGGSVGHAITGTITGSAEESTNNSTWTAVSGTTSDKRYVKVTRALVKYPLWVGGVQVTSANAEDVLDTADGDGATVSFTPAVDDDEATPDVDESSPATLTLNSAIINDGNSDSCGGAIYADGIDLTINVTGDSTVTGPEINSVSSKGIYISNGSLNITGSGTLTAMGGKHEARSIGVLVNKEVTINGTLDAIGDESSDGESCGIYAIGGITVNSAGTLTATSGAAYSGSYGIVTPNVTVNGSLTATGDSQAINGTVKNSIAGTGWTDKEGTTGKASIAVSEAWQELNSYKKVQFPAEPWLYNITIPTTENGTVTAKVDDTEVTNETKVEAGKTVALEVTPDSGYKLDTLDIKYEGIIDSEDTVSEIKEDDILSYAQIKAFVETHEGMLNFAQFNIDEEYHNATYQKKDGVWGFNANDSNMQEQDMSDYNWKCTGGDINNNAYLFEKAVVLIPITPKQDSTDVNKFTFTMPKGDVTVTATFEPSATAPTIKTQPAALELTYGYIEGSVSVEATPSENHTLSYQWYSNTTNAVEGGKVIEGATKASYTIPTGKNAGTEEYYYCVVTAAFMGATATTTSDVVKVTVKKAASSVKTAPKARDITYTGKPQALVEGGTAEGGEMQYSLDGEKYYALVPNGTDAGTYYIWYKVVGDENHLDSDAACVTSKIRADISKTVTFKVVNGSWNDGEAKDKVVKLEGFEGDTLKLSADKIPAVGTKPSDGYKEGSWDVVPKADTEIKADTTFTYTYVKKEEVTPEPTEEPTPSEKAKLTVTAKDQTIDFGGAISKADSKYVIKGLQTGDEAVVTLKADMKKFIITPVVTVKNGDKDVTENYDIEAVEGKLAIKQVPMAMAIAKGNSIKVTTYKIANVDGYLIYTGYCGGTAKLVKTIKGNKAVRYTYKKIAGKALNRKKASKVIVKAYRIVDGKKVVVATSMTAHVAGIKDKKLTNASNITVKAEKLDLKKGNTVNIGAKVSLAAKKKAQLSKGHAAELRYASSNKAVATIDANGKIKAVGKGTCTVYAVAVDGARKAVKVKVK